jgi:hypothetical protein
MAADQTIDVPRAQDRDALLPEAVGGVRAALLRF